MVQENDMMKDVTKEQFIDVINQVCRNYPITTSEGKVTRRVDSQEQEVDAVFYHNEQGDLVGIKTIFTKTCKYQIDELLA